MEGLRLPLAAADGAGLPAEWLDLMEECWAEEAADRPAMPDCSARLDVMQEVRSRGDSRRLLHR